MLKYIIFMCFFTLSLFGAETISFFQGTVNSAKEKAKVEDKIVLIEFIAAYSYDCQVMDQTTWKDQQVVNLTKDHFIAMKVNVDDFDGVVQKKKYNVTTIPTIIFLDGNGKFLGRQETKLQPKEMTKVLQDLVGNEPAPIAQPVLSPSQPKGVDRPIAVPENPSPSTPFVSGTHEGLFQFSARRRAPNGFSVQIGVYADYANVLKATAQLEKDFQVPILVQILETEAQTVYKVLLGAYDDYPAAAKLKGQLAAKGKQGFVKDLSKL
ncbi:MAG: thioredoxin family protein [Bacteroidota bacterium]